MKFDMRKKINRFKCVFVKAAYYVINSQIPRSKPLLRNDVIIYTTGEYFLC